jgi:hypothetical protein
MSEYRLNYESIGDFIEEWQEYYQTRYKNSTMEAYYTDKYERLKKQYADLCEEEVE